MAVRWAVLPLMLVLLAPPSAAVPRNYALKAAKNCTKHPEAQGALWMHKLGSIAEQSITFTVTNAATGKPVPAVLCPGAKYTVTLGFTTLGKGHYLLTSTYGNFSSTDVCSAFARDCPNRVCPADEFITASHNITMPCVLPNGTNTTASHNVMQASWGNGSWVLGNRVTYKLNGTGCKPCVPPVVPPPESPAPSPSPRPSSGAQLRVRAATTTPVVGDTFNVTVSLTGFTTDAARISATISTDPSTAPEIQCDKSVTLVKRSSRFVANPPVSCTAKAGGNTVRVKVTIPNTTPVLANSTAAISVKLRI